MDIKVREASAPASLLGVLEDWVLWSQLPGKLVLWPSSRWFYGKYCRCEPFTRALGNKRKIRHLSTRSCGFPGSKLAASVYKFNRSIIFTWKAVSALAVYSLITIHIKKKPYAYHPCIFEAVKCKLSHHASQIYMPSSATLNCDYNIRSKDDLNPGPDFIVVSNLVLCLYHISNYVFQSICKTQKACRQHGYYNDIQLLSVKRPFP